jgi:hypothetical protein
MTLTFVTLSREIYQERERLKESRNSLLTAAAQPAAAQPLTGAAPDDAALQLQQDPQQLQQPGAGSVTVLSADVLSLLYLQISCAHHLRHAKAEEGTLRSTAHSLEVALCVTQPWQTGRRPRLTRSSSGRCPRGTLQTAAPPSMTRITWRYTPAIAASRQAPQLPVSLASLSNYGLMHTCKRMLACTVISHFHHSTQCSMLASTMQLMPIDLRALQGVGAGICGDRFHVLQSQCAGLSDSRDFVLHRSWRWTCMWRRASGRLTQMQRRRPRTHRSPTAYRPPTSCAAAATCAATALFATLRPYNELAMLTSS